MTRCAALVFHPDPWTGRGKAVPDRCGRPAVTGAIWCGQHRRMVARGVLVKRFYGYVSRMPAAIPFDGTKNFSPPAWVPDWLANEVWRVAPAKSVPRARGDEPTDDEEEEPSAGQT